FTMETHINKVCKTAFYHLHNIRRIRKYLSPESAEILVHAFITTSISWPNYNGLHWLPINYRIEFKVLLITFKAIHGGEGRPPQNNSPENYLSFIVVGINIILITSNLLHDNIVVTRILVVTISVIIRKLTLSSFREDVPDHIFARQMGTKKFGPPQKGVQKM
ncbi:Hypothetical predicted protein, partial [Paramuricea clavata]